MADEGQWPPVRHRHKVSMITHTLVCVQANPALGTQHDCPLLFEQVIFSHGYLSFTHISATHAASLRQLQRTASGSSAARKRATETLTLQMHV